MPTQNAISGRFRVEQPWPSGGMVSRPMDDRNWSVQQGTGYASSTVAAGQWKRGLLYHAPTPVFKSSQLGLAMYDASAPLPKERKRRGLAFWKR